jgi:hypothetical protein
VAETSFERLQTPTAPRAEVRRVGGGWGVEGAHAVASDPKLHLPFDRLPPAPPTVAPPPAPTEAEHRDQLALARKAQQAADAALEKAVEAHGRALALVEERKRALADFATLDSDRLAATLDSLRDDNGGTALPGYDERLIRRETARLDLEAAVQAEATLLAERAVLATAAGNAARESDRLANCVLGHKADAIADKYNWHLHQAGLCKAPLFSFDQFSAGSGANLSGKVTSILMADGMAALTRIRDTSAWRAARDALLADPYAAICIEHAAAPPPVKTVPELSEAEVAARLASLPSQQQERVASGADSSDRVD